MKNLLSSAINKMVRNNEIGGAKEGNSSSTAPNQLLLNTLIQNNNDQSLRHQVAHETQMLLFGRLLSDAVKSKKQISVLRELEFKVFSQWGDDGIIQWLIHHLDIPYETFVEFGVQDYRESNTRFLMMNDNWSGLVMDGSPENVAAIINSEYYWKYDLSAKTAFIDCDNINDLIYARGFEREVGLLHIDIDGVDYWIWKAIEVVSPIILILEYNSVFGIERAITVPYDKKFDRTKAHHSNLFFGASLKAMHQLSAQKGYAFLGCNSAGNNAYFVRRDKLNAFVKEIAIEDGYVLSRFRESRDEQGFLTYISGDERINVIKGMQVYDIESDIYSTL